METKPSAEKVRQVLESEPGLKGLAEVLRARFGARLVALKSADVDIGWGRWRAISESAEPAIVGFNLAEAREEWRRIKAASVQARDSARRGSAPRKPRVVR